MWPNFLVVFIFPLLSASSFVIKPDTFWEQLVKYLRPNEPHVEDNQTLLQMLYTHNRVHVFCKEAMPRTMWNVFQSSRLRLQMPAGGDYKQYKADTMRGVYEAHRQLKENFEGKPLGLGKREHWTISLSAYNEACYGIYTDSPFTLTLEVSSCDLERVGQFTFGLVLWASCPLLVNSRLFAYCSAAALGAHVSGVVMVFAASLSSGGVRSFSRLRSLKTDFKQVFEERPTLVALTLVVGAWIFQAGAKRCRNLWRYRHIRILHCRLLRAVSYCLIMSASDYRGFGRLCVCVLLPWPELWWLLRYLKSRFVLLLRQKEIKPQADVKWPWLRRMRERLQVNRQTTQLEEPQYFRDYPMEENPLRVFRNAGPDPQTILMAQWQEPQHFPNNLGDGNPLRVLRDTGPDPFSVHENNSFNNPHMRRHQEELDRQGRGDKAYPSTGTQVLSSTLNTMSHRSGERSPSPYPEPNVSPIHRNRNYSEFR